MSADALCAIHDCALGISPVTSYSGVKSIYERAAIVCTTTSGNGTSEAGITAKTTLQDLHAICRACKMSSRGQNVLWRLYGLLCRRQNDFPTQYVIYDVQLTMKRTSLAGTRQGALAAYKIVSIAVGLRAARNHG